jgi:hypothetical protein
MEKLSEKYNQENSQKQLTEIYQGFVDARLALFIQALPQQLESPQITPNQE